MSGELKVLACRHSMFEEGSALAEIVAVAAVSALTFVVILALYGWG